MRARRAAAASIGLAFLLLALALAPAASAAPHAARCSPGARTLSHRGDHLYPDTGNGGYASVHTDVHLVYDAAANVFLPGSHVSLTDRATQCLTSFSLDFERRSVNRSAGPDMAVTSVTVNGHPAAFRFAQPAYPGDPKGPGDPNPLAHEASQHNPVGGPRHNPLPPACTPELTSTSAAKQNSRNGTQCPANKLVVTPAAPLPDGSVFTVTVSYTGRPGVHNDGDGTTEGWFRSDKPAGDGGFVTTEPVGSEDWMPLNDHPSAKPTYDFYDTVSAGKTVLANGVLESRTPHPPDTRFPHGSVTWHWHSAAPVASYLVEDSVGNYQLTERTADNGVRFYQAQAASLPAKQQKRNLKVMNKQEDITNFESLFNGTYPFTSDGAVVGRPNASFDEEMQTMITFSQGVIDTDTLYHENMHQWWGDNVSEASYNLTFFKEGMATLGEFLFHAREAEAAKGGPFTHRGQRAFDRSLIKQFNHTYRSKHGFWTAAPSNPVPFGLFSGTATYLRPGIAYIALRQILGKTNFTQALRQIQRRYGGGVITEPQLEAEFGRWLPDQRAACHARLGRFFTQWFDTAYPPGGGAGRRPSITGPRLAGPGFYTHACPAGS
jgi:Peptidase family M1 domain